MTMVNIGVSYRDVPARVLEKIAVPPEMLGDMLARLHAVPSIDEVAVLSTCNRVEVYAAAHEPVERVAWAVAYLLARGRIPVGEVMRTVRVRVGAEAAEHLFSVASGLDSMAIGEEQIVAQIKAAARAAAEAGTKGPVVTGLLDAALRASKRARTDTTIGTAGISLARAGLGLAAVQLGGLAGRNAVVVGTGSMGKLAARLLREAGVGWLSVASRREERAAGLAAAVGGMPLLIADVPVTLADADILVTATAGPAPAVLAAEVRQARARSGGRPLFVLDLGMPPNVEPAVGELAGVTLADITALGRHLADRAVPDQVARARGIVAEEAAAYTARQDQAVAVPVIAAMHAQIRQLADAELARLHDRLPELSDRQRAETAAAVHRILRKALHRPTVRAREFSTGPKGPVYLEALQELFELGGAFAERPGTRPGSAAAQSPARSQARA
jgi:glutamyl-tRNA reductase